MKCPLFKSGLVARCLPGGKHELLPDGCASSLGPALATNSLSRAKRKRRMCANEDINSVIPVKFRPRDSVAHGCSLFGFELFRETTIGPHSRKGGQ
jgi:hypothetical protein